MHRPITMRCANMFAMFALIGFVGGCSSIREWWRNGFKVGPNYVAPSAAVAENWIDRGQRELRPESNPSPAWWTVFEDPMLNRLIQDALAQNLDLRAAGTRILEARALRNIAAGNLFPQQQAAFADYARVNVSRNLATPALPKSYFDNWATGFNLTWELDFWGRFRRAVESANAELDASIANRDDVVVLLIAEVAGAYVEIRTFQERIQFAQKNIEEQSKIVAREEKRGKQIDGFITYEQLLSNLKDTQALKEQLEIGMRQANNRLCVLLGIPPRDLLPILGWDDIPKAPADVAVGIPADLLRRRPDIRRAEMQVAAQSARIGIATSDFYPRFILIGSLGYEAESLTKLFRSNSVSGNIGPSVRWSILNYGRILNNVRFEDARFQRSALDYQSTVLRAAREVEDALVAFIRFQLQTRYLDGSAKNAASAADKVEKVTEAAKFNGNQLFTTLNFKVAQQDKLAVARGNVAQSLIQVYRALGGGWQLSANPIVCGPGSEDVLLPGAEGLPEATLHFGSNNSAARLRE